MVDISRGLNLAQYVSNEVIETDGFYTAIIGLQPSKGARSPILWNAAYNFLHSTSKMIPLDVSISNIDSLIKYLNSENQFLVGSIATPYKELFAKIIPPSNNQDLAEQPSYNCILRGQSEDLVGCNTDGFGAMATINSLVEIKKINTLLIGPGGTGKAIALSIIAQTKKPELLTISGRSESSRDFANTLGASWIHFDLLESVLPEFKLIVNCTPFGQGEHLNRSPITKSAARRMSKGSQIFDINYSDQDNLLSDIARGADIGYVSGKSMNIEQAVRSFCIVNGMEMQSDEIRCVMESAISTK